jgi:integrase
LSLEIRCQTWAKTAVGPLGLVGSNPTPGANHRTHGVLGEILSLAFWMRKQGYRPSTIRSCVNTLKAVAKRANLLDPEDVKTYLAAASVSVNRKEKICQDVARFYKYKGIRWEMPRYQRQDTLPFIPLETELDQLISASGKRTTIFLQILKETGARPGEIWNLKWTDLNFESNTVNIRPEKGSNARQLRISNKIIAMLGNRPRKWQFIFRNPKIDPENSMRTFHKDFIEQRRNIAKRLDNPRLLAISFKTFRHWRASTLYHQTRDLLFVKEQLGHKSLSSTLKYTHLMPFREDEFACKVAKTVEEAKALVESGFDYVTDVEGSRLFRKRK